MRQRTLLVLVLLGLAPLLLGMDSCGGKPTVEFGAVLPLTGPGQVYGESIKQGIELAYEDATRDPQLAWDLVLTVEDSETSAERASSLAEDLYEEALAVIGGVTSDEALAMVEHATKSEKVLLSPTASSPKLSGISKNFFRIFPNSMDEAVAMGNFLEETLKLEKLVVVMEQTAYGEGLAESLHEVTADKAEIVATLAYTGDGDVEDTAKLAVEQGVNAIYVAADGEELSAMLKALRSAGFRGENDWVLSSSSLANPRVIELAEGAAERSFLTQTVFDPLSEEEPMRTFTDHYQARFGTMPDLWAAHGYDAFNVLVKALQEGGGTLPSEFMKGMRSISNYPGVTGNIQFRESGDVQKFERVFYVEGGQLKDFVKWMEERRRALEEKRLEIIRERERLMRDQS